MIKLKATQNIYYHNTTDIVKGKGLIPENCLEKIINKDEIVYYDTINDNIILNNNGNEKIYKLNPYLMTFDCFEIIND